MSGMSEGSGELSDDEFVAAIEAAVDDGERDLCAGGVAPPVLAARVGLEVSWVRKRCRHLADEGRLQAVDGVDAESLQPRTGYLPTAE